MPRISGQKSSNLSFGLGLSFLDSFLQGLGGKASGLEEEYKGANSVVF